MRALLEEYGHTLIALIIASVMLLGLVFGTILPQMGTHSEAVLPKDTPENTWNISAFRANFERSIPSIVVSQPIQITPGSLIDFDDYITNKTFIAVNADGVDISRGIKITPADSQTRKFFNPEFKIFGGPTVPLGEYTFILSVTDRTDNEYFGKTAQQYLKVVVVEAIS